MNRTPATLPPPLTRRQFLRLSAGAACVTGGSLAYSAVEAKWCQVTRRDISLPNLPAAFDGLKVAFLADTHHGPFVPVSYLQRVVEMTNDLRPDVVALGGDYVQRDWDNIMRTSLKYVRPGIEVLGKLRAPMGKYAVMGNHDNWDVHKYQIKAALADAGLCEITNTGVWLERGGARLRLAGVDDFITGRQDIDAAMLGVGPADAAILLQHNPDYLERLTDRRVGLVLSGHTHGGQVVLPFYGPPLLPTFTGQKYAQGLVQGPVARVFVTRGVGTIFPPIRLNCPPEVALLTLRPA